MTLVYNSLSDANQVSKLGLLKRLIRFSGDANLLELIKPFLANSATWPTKWGITQEQAGALYLQVAQCLEKGGQGDESQVFLIRYLATLETASEATIAAAIPHAVQAALSFVKAAAITQKSHFSRLRAVSAALPALPLPFGAFFCLCVCLP